MTVESREPTAEELVDQLRRHYGKSSVKYERVLKRVVKEAEGLTPAHETAVSRFVAEAAGVPAAKAVGVPWSVGAYEDVSLEIVLKIDDKIFVGRERVESYWWLERFRKNPDEWERFLQHFIRSAVGSMANDPDQFSYLRRKLFIITPGDRHNSRLCRASNDTGLNKDLWPRCLFGIVRKGAPSWGLYTDFSPDPVLFSDSRPLGKCQCRCHKHPLNQVDPEYHTAYLSPYDDRLFVA